MLVRQLARTARKDIGQRGFAVDEKSLLIRMNAVKSIQKITKAMKMVAASKMRGELVRLEAGKEFGFNSVDMIFKSDTYLQRKQPLENPDPQEVLCPITSERGLCGGTNSNLIREIKEYTKGKSTDKFELLCMGEKGQAALLRPFPDNFTTCLSEFSLPYNYPTVMAVAEEISRAGENGDKIVIFYNEFKSAILQIVRKMELISKKRFMETLKYGHLYEQKRPDKATSNPALYDLYITSNLWIAVLNNAASEQSARMNAMENASKNAGEIVDDLNLQYNKARQARITMELVEIISGASAL